VAVGPVSAPSGDTLPVVELFGPTLQGEGPAAGQAATFIRFAGCNLSCAWCDSAYTWDSARYDLRAETRQRTATELAEAVLARTGRIVVLTGGEPLLQQHRPAWHELLARLAGRREIHIETNGTIAPDGHTREHARIICVSPKLPNAGGHRGHQDPAMDPRWATIAPWHGGAHLKVVVTERADLDLALELGAAMRFPRERIWVMPEGTTAAVLAARWPGLAAAAAELGINASHRLHVLAWGDERGH
jgi:organic radical activating enzyme